MIETHPLTRHIGGRMTGIDARRPLTPEEVRAVDAGMDKYAVLVLPGQDIDDAQQLAFTANFGAFQEGANSTERQKELRLDPAFADVSNLDREGRKLARDDRRRMASLGNRLWHSDASFRIVPAKYSILSGRIVVTKGGNTEFADMRAAYDALDPATRDRIAGLSARHSLRYSQGRAGLLPSKKNEHGGYDQPGAVDAAIKDIIEQHVRYAGAQGFATNLGGLVTAAVAMPANIVGLSLIQCRMVAGIAHLRGYDLDDPRVRNAILETLLGEATVNAMVKKKDLPGPPMALATRAAWRMSAQCSNAGRCAPSGPAVTTRSANTSSAPTTLKPASSKAPSTTRNRASSPRPAAAMTFGSSSAPFMSSLRCAKSGRFTMPANTTSLQPAAFNRSTCLPTSPIETSTPPNSETRAGSAKPPMPRT